MKWETDQLQRESQPLCQSVDCHGRWRKPWKMEKKVKRWSREGEASETKKGRSRVRDIPGDEREGSPPEKMLYDWLSPEKMLCDWLPPEVEHSVAASGRVSFWSFSPNFCCLQLGLGFCFREQLGFFFLFPFMATLAPTRRAPSSRSVKGAIKVRLKHASLEKAYTFQELRFIIYASRRFCPASP